MHISDYISWSRSLTQRCRKHGFHKSLPTSPAVHVCLSLSLSLRLYGGECPDWGAEEAREEVLQLGWRAAE